MIKLIKKLFTRSKTAPSEYDIICIKLNQLEQATKTMNRDLISTYLEIKQLREELDNANNNKR